MKLAHLVVAILIATTLSVVSLNVVHAQWSAINNSGYAVTTNRHGQKVLIGENVTAWAGTTNSSVYQVEFKWKNETDQVIFDENVTLVNYTTPDYPPGATQEMINWAIDSANKNITVWYANNTQIPNCLGNWTVQVFFYAPGGHLCGQESDIVQIRATSTNVIPDLPVVGTAGGVVAMLLGLSLFLHKKI